MPVIKNGLATGTTVGWFNELKALVRHYDHYTKEFKFSSFEVTIVLGCHNPRQKGSNHRPAYRWRRLDQ
ncbi:hypothetical protein D9615_004357 [Tricholomella constricta]|uniref:Uncharacterized protein n=1 Tax=Tricholomella constricta TaxID=117010 RepID=A0A8H5M5G3_9AGAR|nr:hypothetical protein D9615_004357 [Tricholomella constricta]